MAAYTAGFMTHVTCRLTIFSFNLYISLKTSGKFQPKHYKVRRSFAENYKSRQIPAVFLVQSDLFFLIRPESLHCRRAYGLLDAKLRVVHGLG